ncbi:MAG TPA: nucleotidyltransferase family protein [Candidatus Limnocylindrales bacterium]|nr:nucleotidyltransferase family protein [Candidatus Limnocylindrales bacterium]
MFDAVVLAGGGKPEPLTVQERVSNKAFIKLHGKPLLGYILESLVEASSVDCIVVIGPEEELKILQQSGYVFLSVPEKGTMLDNLAAGFEAVKEDRLCLVVTGDIPLLTAAVIEDFVERCAPFDHDFYYPILTRECCSRRFPETERTYVHLKEGEITGGNIGLLRPDWFLKNRSQLEIFISSRKKPLRLLRMLSFSLIIKYIFRKLAVSDLEDFFSRLLNLRVRAVVCEHVEIGTDVDKISDLAAVRRALQNKP